MDMHFSQADRAFQQEVRAFLAANLPERMRQRALLTPGAFAPFEDWIGWQRISDFWDEHPYGNNRW